MNILEHGTIVSKINSPIHGRQIDRQIDVGEIGRLDRNNIIFHNCILKMIYASLTSIPNFNSLFNDKYSASVDS